MSLSPLHIIVVLLLVLLLFGTGKLPRLMGDLAEGIKAFKKGMKDEKGERGTNESGTNESGTKEGGRLSPPDIDHEPVESLRNSEDLNDRQRHDDSR